jgi:hypothetical protein
MSEVTLYLGPQAASERRVPRAEDSRLPSRAQVVCVCVCVCLCVCVCVCVCVSERERERDAPETPVYPSGPRYFTSRARPFELSIKSHFWKINAHKMAPSTGQWLQVRVNGSKYGFGIPPRRAFCGYGLAVCLIWAPHSNIHTSLSSSSQR